MQNYYSVNNLCLDLDGTVYRDGVVFPGIKSKLNDLSNKGVKIWYITNNTSKSRIEYFRNLGALELPVLPNALITPIEVFNKSHKR